MCKTMCFIPHCFKLLYNYYLSTAVVQLVTIQSITNLFLGTYQLMAKALDFIVTNQPTDKLLQITTQRI